MSNIRLGLDIDDVVANFTQGFLEYGKLSYNWTEQRDYYFRPWLSLRKFNRLFNEVKKKRAFWMSLLPFELYIPSCCKVYVTAREAPDEWTRDWLNMWELSPLPIANTNKLKCSKASLLKRLTLDGLIDDNPTHYTEAVEAGFGKCSFLVSRPWNAHILTPNRIFSLLELKWMLPNRIENSYNKKEK